MSNTSVHVDPKLLEQVKTLTGTKADREAVELALRTLIAVRTQPAAVSRIVQRQFSDAQIDAPTIAYLGRTGTGAAQREI